MANQEHLDILRQGVDGWNEWRKQRPEIRPDLTRANLGDAFLNRGDFIGTDLFGANLLWARLDGLTSVNLLLAMLISAKQILLRLASWGLISSKLNLPEQI